MTLTPGFSFIIRNFPGSFELTKDSCPPLQLPPCESTTYILKKALRYTKAYATNVSKSSIPEL